VGVPLCPNLGLLQVINSRRDIFNATSTTTKVCFVDLVEKLVTFQFDTPIGVDGFGFVAARVSIEYLQGG